MAPRSNLSARGTEAAAGGAGNEIFDVLANQYHAESNPSGYVSLGIAENALMHDEVIDFISKTPPPPRLALTYGDGATGSRRLRKAAARFLTRRLKSVKPVEVEHVAITNGLTTAIEQIAWVLADPGDGFLLGQPYYRSFVSDVNARPGANIIPVSFGSVDPFSIDGVARYEAALLASQIEGVKVKGLILCHPHNPLGRCYPPDTVRGLMKLCQRYGIHFISDEIYALSVFENHVDPLPQPTPFESALSIRLEGIIDPSLVHVLWGMSKDFCSNGLRIGVVVSQSYPAFMAAVTTLSLYTYPSSLAEHVTAELLEDYAFTDRFIRTNAERLSDAYAFTAQILRQHNIAYAPGANAAFFLWIDLASPYRSRHPETRDEDITGAIFQALMKRKVFLVSGDVAGAERPGWFRLVFSQPRPYLEEGLRRMVGAIGGGDLAAVTAKL